MNVSNRLAIAGETYSANLGDGVIAESLAHIIHKIRPEAKTAFIDISGQKQWPAESTSVFGHVPGTPFLALLPKLNNVIRWHLVRKRRTRTVWQKELGNIHTLLIGGGQLLMDNDLDFPLKIHALVKEATQRKVPIHFVACGVNSRWSRQATILFRQSLERAESISVRDAASAKALRALVPQFDPHIVFDPAIWAADLYGRQPTSVHPKLVGLGIISLAAVNRRYRATVNEEQLFGLWQGIMNTLTQRGLPFELFTNGSPDDQATAYRLAQQTEERYIFRCPVAPRPTRPIELAQRIGNYAAVIAARLHASIIAASYLVPAIGLAWDKKVDAFYASLGRPSLSLDLATSDPEAAMRALDEASAMPLDPTHLDACRASALTGIQSLVTR